MTESKEADAGVGGSAAGESSGDSTVLEDIGLDVFDSADVVGGGRVLLFARVIKSGVGLAAG
jgi:hypothetical protein